MAELHYKVLVTSRVTRNGSSYIASIPDLDCQAFGASPGEAIEASRRQALGKLREFEGSTNLPPRPSELSLAVVELPAPQPRGANRLRLLAGGDELSRGAPSEEAVIEADGGGLVSVRRERTIRA